MKRTLKLVAIATMAMGVMAAQAQEVTFRRTFTEGATEKYTISSQVTSTTDLSSMGQGEMSMNIDTTMDADYTYSGLKEDGSALLKFVYSNIAVKADGPMAEMMGNMGDSMPKEVKGSAKIDAFGKLTETKYEGNSANMMAMMSGGGNAWDMLSFFSFPEKAIKVGDTWDFELPTMGGMFEKGSKLTGKFIGDGKFNDKDAWKLEFTGKPKMTMDIGKMMQANPASQDSGMPQMNIVMEGVNSMKITVFVDQKTGQLFSIDSASEVDAKVKLVDMGAEFPVTAQGIIKMTLKK